MNTKIEDVIPEILKDIVKDTALDFTVHLRKNKMSPGYAGYAKAWDAKCKDKTICKISLARSIKKPKMQMAIGMLYSILKMPKNMKTLFSRKICKIAFGTMWPLRLMQRNLYPR